MIFQWKKVTVFVRLNSFFTFSFLKSMININVIIFVINVKYKRNKYFSGKVKFPFNI